MSAGPRRVLVVGGGAAGVITAAALLRQAAGTEAAGTAATGTGPTSSAPVDVVLAERSPEIGPGLAYGTADPQLLLNNYAGRMSAVEDDPLHLVRWCRAHGTDADPATFLPRATYGRYLADLLDDTLVPAGSTLTRVHDEVVSLSDVGGSYRATTAGGAVLTADVVVLALGNPPPLRPRGITVDDLRLAPDPWDPDLLDRVAADARVLLVGTGLTTVDVAAQVAAARPGARITAVSRHGLLPLRHVAEPPGAAEAFDAEVRSLPELLREVRRCLDEGESWRCVVESLKLVANDVWRALSHQEKEQFARHVGRHWEIARHRMAPSMAALVDDLLADGRLRLGTPREVDVASYDLVVNCTGPAPVTTPGWNPLVDDLAVKGMLWPGPLGLGLEVDADGALGDADGVGARGMYAVGAARRGSEWEVAAVPDIRRQAERLAWHLATTTVARTGLVAS